MASLHERAARMQRQQGCIRRDAQFEAGKGSLVAWLATSRQSELCFTNTCIQRKSWLRLSLVLKMALIPVMMAVVPP